MRRSCGWGCGAGDLGHGGGGGFRDCEVRGLGRRLMFLLFVLGEGFGCLLGGIAGVGIACGGVDDVARAFADVWSKMQRAPVMRMRMSMSRDVVDGWCVGFEC